LWKNTTVDILESERKALQTGDDIIAGRNRNQNFGRSGRNFKMLSNIVANMRCGAIDKNDIKRNIGSG
jgi:hypothetical protein